MAEHKTRRERRGRASSFGNWRCCHACDRPVRFLCSEQAAVIYPDSLRLDGPSRQRNVLHGPGGHAPLQTAGRKHDGLRERRHWQLLVLYANGKLLCARRAGLKRLVRPGRRGPFRLQALFAPSAGRRRMVLLVLIRRSCGGSLGRRLQRPDHGKGRLGGGARNAKQQWCESEIRRTKADGPDGYRARLDSDAGRERRFRALLTHGESRRSPRRGRLARASRVARCVPPAEIQCQLCRCDTREPQDHRAPFRRMNTGLAWLVVGIVIYAVGVEAW